MPNRPQPQDSRAQQEQPGDVQDVNEGQGPQRVQAAIRRPASGGVSTTDAILDNQWAMTGIVVAVVVVLCLIIGFATRGTAQPAADVASDAEVASSEPPSADVVASEDASSQARTSTPTITADQVSSAIDDGAVTFDGSAVGFRDPQFSVSGTTLTGQDDYVDPDTSVEQAVALAYYVFTTDPSVSQVTFQSMSSSGSASVSITVDSSATSAATLRDLQGDTPESIYPQLYSYTISQGAHDAMGYDIPTTGGTSSGSAAASSTAATSGASSTSNTSRATSAASASSASGRAASGTN